MSKIDCPNHKARLCYMHIISMAGCDDLELLGSCADHFAAKVTVQSVTGFGNKW